MKTLKQNKIYNAPPEQVFKAIDDLGVTGTHMTQSSGMMMGNKLKLEYLTKHHTGLGTKYRWTGKMMYMSMDFTVEVTKWMDGKEKTWETIGETQLIIYSWYRMYLLVTPQGNQTNAELSISYEKPFGFFDRILCFFFADWYCRWCLSKMLGDAGKALETQKNERYEIHN